MCSLPVLLFLPQIYTLLFFSIAYSCSMTSENQKETNDNIIEITSLYFIKTKKEGKNSVTFSK